MFDERKHLGIATTQGMDCLVTWIFRHTLSRQSDGELSHDVRVSGSPMLRVELVEQFQPTYGIAPCRTRPEPHFRFVFNQSPHRELSASHLPLVRLAETRPGPLADL